MKKDNETILAWHWCRADMRTQHSNESILAGKWLEAKGRIELCSVGLHASLTPMEALQYAPGPILCRVELRGEIIRGDDKLCARRRRVLWHINADHLLHEFACLCAERALKAAKVEDKRSWAAIQAKRDWLAGKITDAELAAAGDAARAAARAAAWDAAWDAAWAAARAAAWDAAWDAAGDAARAAAWDAAGDAERKWQAKTLLALVQKQARKEGHTP